MKKKDFLDIEEIFSKALRVGRCTYFFDARVTRVNDCYLTITENEKFTHDDNSFHYKKHKTYLYKEDFELFKDILNEMAIYVSDERGEEVISERHQRGFKREYYAEGLNEVEATPNRGCCSLNSEDL